MEALLGLFILGALVCAYFLPFIVAAMRSHPNAGPIFVVDLFLGWTLIGWVAALAWSCTSQRSRA